MADATPTTIPWYGFVIAKTLEAVPLMTRGVSTRKDNNQRYKSVSDAYRRELKGLKFLALLRPHLMIVVSILLVLVAVAFILIVYASYSPSSALGPLLGNLLPYSMSLGLLAIIVGILAIVLTIPDYGRLYAILRHILPQPQQILASRIERGDPGYFRVDEAQTASIALKIVRGVLQRPGWYQRSEVYTPSSPEERRTHKYANFIFFGELLEAQLDNPLKMWGGLQHVYSTTPLFEPDTLKNLDQQQSFSRTLIDELRKHSADPTAFTAPIRDSLDANLARLGNRFQYDARNIGHPRLWRRIFMACRLQSLFEAIEAELSHFATYGERPSNRLVLIKLMAIRRIWAIPWGELPYPFSPWQCVFLLRAGIIQTDLDDFSSRDHDFAWFRNDALRKTSIFVERTIRDLLPTDRQRVEAIIKDTVDLSSASILTDTFLWMVGSYCCRFQNCATIRDTQGLPCPFADDAFSEPAEGKKLFTYHRPTNRFVRQ